MPTVEIKNSNLSYAGDVKNTTTTRLKPDDLISDNFFGTLKDSGSRQQFDTGAVRDNGEGKGRFDLIPTQLLFRLAQHYERGAKKYDDRNWEKGMSVSRCVDAAMRHLNKYVAGWNDEPHLDAAVWNLAAIMFYEYNNPELMDLPDRKDLGIEEIQKWCKFKED